MKGFFTAQSGHVVNLLPPIDLTNGPYNTPVFSMRDHAHVSIVIQGGVSVGAVSTITIEECSDFTPTAHTAIPFNVYKCETSNADVLGAVVACTNAGFAMSTADDIYYVIELDSSALDEGYPCLRVCFTKAGASQLGSAVAILSGARFAGDQNATEIV